MIEILIDLSLGLSVLIAVGLVYLGYAAIFFYPEWPSPAQFAWHLFWTCFTVFIIWLIGAMISGNLGQMIT